MKKYLLSSVLLASVLFPVVALAQTITLSPQSYCSAIYSAPFQAAEQCQTQQDYSNLQNQINGVLSDLGNTQSDQQATIYLKQELQDCRQEINAYSAITDPSLQILWQQAEQCQTNQNYVLVQDALSSIYANGGVTTGITQSLLPTCKQQIAAYNTSVQDYNACVPQEQQNQTDAQAEVAETAANYCTNTYGQYAHAGSSSTSCTCQQGYEFLDNHSACVSYSSYCDVKYGQNATANSDGTCSISCPVGSTYNSSTQVCVMQASTPVVSPPAPAVSPQPSASLTTAQIPSVSNQINPVVSHHTATTHSALASLPITANATTTVVTATSSPIGSITAIAVTTNTTIPPVNVSVAPTPAPSFLTVLENLIDRLNPFSWF